MSDVINVVTDATIAVEAPAVVSKFKFPIIDLPSSFLPYGFTKLNARKFTPRDLSKIFHSSRSENFLIMIEALGATIDEDINELTIPDFYYLMYWHRLNSYPNSPFETKWVSMYGSDETYVLTPANIQVNHIKMTAAEYEASVHSGLRIPTVYDLIEIQTRQKQATTDDSWLIERAQFIQGNSLEEKLETLDGLGIEFLEHMRQFGVESEHGVKEDIEVQTSMTFAEAVASVKKSIADGNDDMKDVLTALILQGHTVAEPVKIAMNIFSFFPNL